MPDPSTHLRRGVTYTPADPDWADWDRAWTTHVKTLTGRTDLTVVVAPGASGRSSPPRRHRHRDGAASGRQRHQQRAHSGRPDSGAPISVAGCP